jgi:translation initiation factor 2 subunit 1
MSKEQSSSSVRGSDLPDVGELVIATVTRITSHGAYASLDEHQGHEAFIHISEIASTWVRNIRNFVRESQKIVGKVLRVDMHRGQVDLSLRRVTKEHSRMKIQEWKRGQRGKRLLELAAERLKTTYEEAFEVAGKLMESNYSDMLEALEEAKEKGIKILRDIGIPKKWADILLELALAHVIVREVSLEVTVKLTCSSAEGVEGVRKALLAAQAIVAPTKGEVFVDGAPRYRIRIKAKGAKDAESILDRAVEESLRIIEECGGEGSVVSRS